MLQPTKLRIQSKQRFICKTLQFGFCILGQDPSSTPWVFWPYRKIGIHTVKYLYFCDTWSKTVKAKTTDFALHLF